MDAFLAVAMGMGDVGGRYDDKKVPNTLPYQKFPFQGIVLSPFFPVPSWLGCSPFKWGLDHPASASQPG